MNVIVHPTHGMNIDIQLSTNARNVGPQFGAEFALDGFVPSFRTEYHMHHVLRVGMGHVPHLRCSASYIPRTQRLRAGLKYGAPTALERRPSRHGAEERGRARHSGCCPESTMPCAFDVIAKLGRSMLRPYKILEHRTEL